MIFRDWIIWLDITACEKILGLAPKLTTVILHNPCLAWTTHSPHRVTYLPCHLIPLYRKESVTHTVLNCSSTDAPGCRLWEVRYLSPPSYASLLLGVRTSQKNRMARTDRREVWTQGKDATLPPDTAKANNEYNSHRDQPWIPDKDQERRWKRLGICSEWQLSKTMSTILSQSFLLSQFHVLPCRGVKDRDLLSNAAAETPPRCPQPPSHTAHLLWDTVSWHAGKLTMAIPRKKWHSYKHETFKGTALCMEGNCLEKSWEQGRRWSWSLVSVQVMVLRSELFPPFLQGNSRTIFPLMSKSF